MTISARGRGITDRVVVPVARGLARMGATANGLTLSGMVMVVAGAVLAASGRLVAGGLVIAAGALTDAVDGAVARIRGSAGRYGGFLDSVCDRISDAAVLGAVVWLVRDDPAATAAGLVALVGALVTSYVRAKAEAVGFTASVGIIERPERLLIAVPALVFGAPAVAAWVLAAGSVITVGQRLVSVRIQAATAATDAMTSETAWSRDMGSDGGGVRDDDRVADTPEGVTGADAEDAAEASPAAPDGTAADASLLSAGAARWAARRRHRRLHRRAGRRRTPAPRPRGR